MILFYLKNSLHVFLRLIDSLSFECGIDVIFMQIMCLFFDFNLFPWMLFAIDTSLKKSDNEIVRSKDWRAYMATMAVDFLVIVLPVVFFLTVSLLLCSWKLLRQSNECAFEDFAVIPTTVWSGCVLLMSDNLWEYFLLHICNFWFCVFVMITWQVLAGWTYICTILLTMLLFFSIAAKR